ncbi:MAG: DUF3347 domain-containing protein, partial [Opitutae bacterium]|nr:DUF3347 domain-containing protein [Opitutae bacterium]
MRNFRRPLIVLLVLIAVLSGVAASAHDSSAPLTAPQKAFLANYEAVRAALAADDLTAAKTAAAALAAEPDPSPPAPLTPAQQERQAAFTATVRKLAAAGSLVAARDAFKQLSQRAIHLAAGKTGYHVAHCPGVPDDAGYWVQTAPEI